MPVPDVATFDISDPAFVTGSPQVHAAREAHWYARTNVGIAVLRFEEAEELIKDRRLRQGMVAWPATHGITEGLLVEWWSEIMINLEGADHKRVRGLVHHLFTRAPIERLTPRFHALAHELIDGFIERGSCEFVGEFAEPYSTRVILELLGIPEADDRQVAAWCADVGASFGITIKQDLPKIEAGLRGMLGLADELIVARRDQPGDDLVSELVAARDGADRLTDSEIRATIGILLLGGVDTTRNQLALGLMTFMEHPDQWRLLAERPELGAPAVEEVMRVNPTVTWITRQATEDLTFRGLDISAGTTIHLFVESADTDPRVFGDAPFDITAAREHHLGFGGGIHHCIGHWLSRIDMREAFPILSQRLRDPALAGPVPQRPASGLTGPISVPIRFTPGARGRLSP